MSGNQTAPPISTIDPYEYLQLAKNHDGTITRLFEYPTTPAAPDLDSPFPVLTKDVPLNPNHNTWLCIFLPRQALDHQSSTNVTKLPLIVYYHSGGFIINIGPSSTMHHEFCAKMAVELATVVVSVEYRLAPEHRLPAAYDDSVEVLPWIKGTHEKWLLDYADFSKCFLMGSSAGGNITYHVGLRSSTTVDDFHPLKIKGLILHHPFFGGSQRTGSELRLINDRILPLSASDLMWELAIPIGANRDHEYCNPTVGGGSDLIDQIRVLGWRVLVTGCDGDPLIDGQIELAEMLKKRGVQVEMQFNEGDYHAVELVNPTKAMTLFALLKDFIGQS